MERTHERRLHRCTAGEDPARDGGGPLSALPLLRQMGVNLSDRARVILSRILVGVGLAGGITTVVAYAVAGDVSLLVDEQFALDQLQGVVVTGAIVLLALPQRPANGALWVLAWVSLSLGLEAAGTAVGFAVTGIPFAELDSVVPADLEPLGSIAFLFPQALWPNFLLFLTFGILLFPDGKLPSPRWRWVARLAGWSLFIVVAVSAWAARPWSTGPYLGDIDEPTPLTIAALLAISALLVCVVASLVSLIMRFRRSSGIERQQFRWMVWGFSIFVIGAVIPFSGVVARGVSFVTGLILAASYGIAITRYRLYDIDVVISKTVVYGSLAAFIGGVYVAVVVGIGTWIGAGTSSLALSIAATALVAVIFEPVRERVQRLASRLVYGKRATPYQVLADLTARLASAESTEGLLERMVQRLSEATGATLVTVRLAGEDSPVAIWPPDAEDTRDDGEFTVQITSGDEVLGSVSVLKRRGEPLTPAERALVEDLAGGASMVLQKARLNADLAAKAEALRSSRRRLVDAQADQQRRLERELHDGAQQQIVALKIKLGLAARMAEEEETDGAGSLIEQMANDAQQAIEEIRALAKGIFPPLLEKEGLKAALAAGAANTPIPVIVDADGVGRFPPDIEAAAYFCITEAVTNAVKHSGAEHIDVHLSDVREGLEFAVSDDGEGFSPDRLSDGSGLIGMRDRLEAVGGTLTVTSAPGEGVRIDGFVPLPAG